MLVLNSNLWAYVPELTYGDIALKWAAHNIQAKGTRIAIKGKIERKKQNGNEINTTTIAPHVHQRRNNLTKCDTYLMVYWEWAATTIAATTAASVVRVYAYALLCTDTKIAGTKVFLLVKPPRVQLRISNACVCVRLSFCTAKGPFRNVCARGFFSYLFLQFISFNFLGWKWHTKYTRITSAAAVQDNYLCFGSLPKMSRIKVNEMCMCVLSACVRLCLRVFVSSQFIHNMILISARGSMDDLNVCPRTQSILLARN